MLKLEFKPSVPSVQKAWWLEALSRMTFKKDAWTVALEGTVQTMDDPPCPGHSDYMCTETTYWVNDTPTISWTIITDAEDPTQSFNAGVRDDVKAFFMESVIHEYAHGLMHVYFARGDGEKANIASWFKHRNSGKVGQLDDWSPENSEWEDRIEEAIAEFFKDVYMPEQFRYFQQRTNWQFQKQYFPSFLNMVEGVLCPIPPTDV